MPLYFKTKLGGESEFKELQKTINDDFKLDGDEGPGYKKKAVNKAVADLLSGEDVKTDDVKKILKKLYSEKEKDVTAAFSELKVGGMVSIIKIYAAYAAERMQARCGNNLDLGTSGVIISDILSDIYILD